MHRCKDRPEAPHPKKGSVLSATNKLQVYGASAEWIFQKSFFYILLKNKRFLNAFNAVSQLFFCADRETSVKIDWLSKTALMAQRTDINNGGGRDEWIKQDANVRVMDELYSLLRKMNFLISYISTVGDVQIPCSRGGGILLAWLRCVVGCFFYVCVCFF